MSRPLILFRIRTITETPNIVTWSMRPNQTSYQIINKIRKHGLMFIAVFNVLTFSVFMIFVKINIFSDSHNPCIKELLVAVFNEIHIQHACSRTDYQNWLSY